MLGAELNWELDFCRREFPCQQGVNRKKPSGFQGFTTMSGKESVPIAKRRGKTV